jgi:hypothetical protein
MIAGSPTRHLRSLPLASRGWREPRDRHLRRDASHAQLTGEDSSPVLELPTSLADSQVPDLFRGELARGLSVEGGRYVIPEPAAGRGALASTP